MKKYSSFSIPILMLGLAYLAPAAHAQTALVSVQPISAVIGVYNAEAEVALGTNVTVGLSGTYWGFEEEAESGSSSAELDVSYVSTDFKVRFYPSAALEGFSFGGLVGATGIGGEANACSVDPNTGQQVCDDPEAREWALSAGVELDYVWRLGSSRQFSVILGLGGKRLFAGDDIDTILAYPFGRLSIGYVF